MKRILRTFLIPAFLLLFPAACTVDFDAVEKDVREARKGIISHEWRQDSTSLQVTMKGKVGFNEDESRIETVEPEGYVEIEERNESERWRIEVTRRPNGEIERKFIHNREPVGENADGRAWLADVLPKIIRETGVEAGARVQRILGAEGAKGVVSEIEAIRSSTIQRIYVDELVANADLEPPEIRRLAVVAANMSGSSDVERVVTQLADLHPEDESVTEALIESLGRIRSSSLRVRVAEFIMSQRRVGELAAIELTKVISEVRSSSEHANGLVALAEAAPDSPKAWKVLLESAGEIRYDSERGRALRALVERGSLNKELAIQAAQVAASIRSSSERARTLSALITEVSLEPEVVASLLEATQAISASAQDQVLTSLIRQDIGRPELEKILKFVQDNLPEGSISERLQNRIQRRLSES